MAELRYDSVLQESHPVNPNPEETDSAETYPVDVSPEEVQAALCANDGVPLADAIEFGSRAVGEEVGDQSTGGQPFVMIVESAGAGERAESEVFQDLAVAAEDARGEDEDTVPQAPVLSSAGATENEVEAPAAETAGDNGGNSPPPPELPSVGGSSEDDDDNEQGEEPYAEEGSKAEVTQEAESQTQTSEPPVTPADTIEVGQEAQVDVLPEASTGTPDAETVGERDSRQELQVEAEQPNELLQVKRYDFKGPIAEMPEVMDSTQKFLDATPSKTAGLPEVTENYRTELAAVQDVTVDYARELGVDVRPRLRGMDHIHIHPPDQTDEFREALGSSENVFATRDGAGHQYILERGIAETPVRAAHESMHSVLYAALEPAIWYDDKKIHIELNAGAQDGFTSSETGEYEAVTGPLVELAVAKQIRDHWPNYADLSQLDAENIKPGYPELTVMFDRILSTTDNPELAFQELQRGLLTGDRDALQVLVPVVGEEGLRMLANTNPRSLPDVAYTAYRLAGMKALSESPNATYRALLSWLPRRQTS